MKKNLFNLKIAAIGQFVSRSGTIFIHSLLDNHPEIITIPATIDINEFLINQKFSSAAESYKIFEKNNPKFFDTSKFTIKDKYNSKLNVLGNNKKKKILTDKKIFEKNFLNILKKKKINSKNILKAIYLAYALTHKKRLSRAKIILFHPHEKNKTLAFNNIFKNSLYIIPLRNPIKAYESVIKKIKQTSKIRKEIFYPASQLIQSAMDIENFYKKNMNIHFIKIENLVDNLKNEMKKLSKFLKIKFHKNMLKSTFGGLKYWGNTPFKNYNELNKKIHQDHYSLPRKDLIILKLINDEFLDTLRYKKITLNLIEKIFLPIIFFLPMRVEMEFLKNIKLKNIFHYIKFLIFFIPKRILLIYILIINKFSKRYIYLAKKINY